MWSLEQVVTLWVVVLGVSSMATNKTQPSLTTTDAPPSTATGLESSHSMASASIGQVETLASVQEVNEDWSDDYTEGGDVEEPPSTGQSSTELPEVPYKKNLTVNKDNLIALLKTISLAYTHKENPSYSELLKAGGISAFKTGLKYLGKDKLGRDLLSLAKKVTSLLDEDESSDALGELAEDFLASHHFKLVVPESFLLHETEMEEFLSSRIEGRALNTNTELSVSMPRTDPTVTTLLSIGPMSWLAILGGLFSIPYFLSESTPESRVDAFRPSTNMRAPGLPFLRPQLRRDEREKVPQHPRVDKELQEYHKTYARWYYQWYLKYKEYYDRHYPYDAKTRPQGTDQKQEKPPVPQKAEGEPVHARRPQRRQPAQRVRQQLPRQQLPRQQTQRKPTTKQPKGPRNQQPGRRPQRRPGRPAVSRPQQTTRPVLARPNQRPLASLRPVQAEGNGLLPNGAAAIQGGNPSTFGTFQRDDHKGDTHFRVIHGQEVAASSATTFLQAPRPPPRAPSPQPVYVPTTESVPRTETGFKPIIKPDNPLAGGKRQAESKPQDAKQVFRPPKQETVFPKVKATPTPKARPDTQTSSGWLKPFPKTGTPQKAEPESTTRKVSSVTSRVFKTTAPPTPAPATTPQPAVFFRTATEKSVRVVTSSSFVTQATAPSTKEASQERRRPPRHHESRTPSKDVPSQPKTAGPKVVRTREEPAAPRSEPLRKGFVRTNVPTSIKVVEHRPAQGFGLVTEPQGSTTASTTTTTTSVPIYALDPFYGSRLSRIDAIFHQMKVQGEGCREQVVCNIYKNPDVFTPFSDFLSRQLTVTVEELQRPKISDDRILRFFRYLRAAREGQDGSECKALYPECHMDTAALSHQPIISNFQKVSLLMDAKS